MQQVSHASPIVDACLSEQGFIDRDTGIFKR